MATSISNQQKSVLITGTNKGIGLSLVKEFAQDNYKVFALCRKTSEALSDIGESYKLVNIRTKIDVREGESLKELASELQTQNEKLHVLISNAGVYQADTWETLTADNILETFKVNTLGTFNVINSMDCS
jgi:NAD(P)-dependent dehydrogenase (short-subunit alcohol dehydrogenase family)